MGHGSREHKHQHNRHWVTGSILIGIGSLFLLDRLDYLDAPSLRHYWPFIFAIVGVVGIVGARSAEHVAKGGFLVFLAFWLYASLEHVWGLSLHNSWPMILIALGLRHIFVGLAGKDEDQTGEKRT